MNHKILVIIQCQSLTKVRGPEKDGSPGPGRPPCWSTLTKGLDSGDLKNQRSTHILESDSYPQRALLGTVPYGASTASPAHMFCVAQAVYPLPPSLLLRVNSQACALRADSRQRQSEVERTHQGSDSSGVPAASRAEAEQEAAVCEARCGTRQEDSSAALCPARKGSPPRDLLLEVRRLVQIGLCAHLLAVSMASTTSLCR